MRRFGRVRLADGERFVTIDEQGTFASVDAPWAQAESARVPLASFDPRGAEYLPPVSPSKIIGVGKNYHAHARELGSEAPAEPLIFLKPPTSLTSHRGTVVLPAASERVEFEGELAVVIGARARAVAVERALDYVLGYTVACDVTARDLQRRDGQWTRAKGFDTFCPLGPWVIDADPAPLEIETFVNDRRRQHGRVADMVFSIPTLIAAISQVMTLLPGDVVLTGTPEGVGPLAAGDRVQVRLLDVSLEFAVASGSGDG